MTQVLLDLNDSLLRIAMAAAVIFAIVGYLRSSRELMWLGVIFCASVVTGTIVAVMHAANDYGPWLTLCSVFQAISFVIGLVITCQVAFRSEE